MEKIKQPEPINKNHILNQFNSGELALDYWLQQRALDNNERGASRTFVIHQNNLVLGYYCLATGAVSPSNAPGKMKRNMPNPIPVMVLGRLAVDKTCQSQGFGKGLLKDAVLRTIRVSQEVGVKALIVHAISQSAQHFYKRFGFIESPLEEMTLMLPLK